MSDGGGEIRVQPGAMAREELAIPPDLDLYTLPDEEAAVAELDPVTYEVIRHRVQRINEEHASTIAQVSGSPVVAAAQDFNVMVADEIGNAVAVGTYVLWHGTILDGLIKNVLATRGHDVGIREGSMFLVNDPFLGCGHYNDAAILSPIFIDDQLVSWTGSMLHQIDVGGNAFGSFCINAKDPFDEPRPFPPVAIVENGKIRADVLEVWLSHSRFPESLELDLRAQVAGNNVAARRIREVAAEYGTGVFATVLKKMIAEADAQFRQRLAEIPDGRWRHVEYIDKSGLGDDRIHEARLTVEKKGERLIFDTSESDDQVGILNCTEGAFRAGAVQAILMQLCPDLPWASTGILRNVDFRSRPGTIVSAVPPGLVSCAGGQGLYTAMKLSERCVSLMLSSSERFYTYTGAMDNASWTLMMITGTNARQAPFLAMLMDPMAGAVAARSTKDGVDTGGVLHSPQSGLPDVELFEAQYPLLWLYRRQEADSGGAGKWRGGTSAGIGVILHDTDRPITMDTLATGVCFPTNWGLAGGNFGGTIRYAVLRDSDVDEILAAGKVPAAPPAVGESGAIGGRIETIDFKGTTTMEPGDALFVRMCGGGGYGDPLERDPELVVADVARGYVSPGAAEGLYGVVLDDDGGVDIATEARRVEIIEKRRDGARAGNGSWQWQPE